MTTDDAAAHDDNRLLVHALVDGELDPANALAVERQIAADPVLSAERANTEALRRVLQEKLPRKPLPPQLRPRIAAAVGLGQSRPTWRLLAASVVFALIIAGAATWFAVAPAPGDRIAEAIVDSHARALLASQPIEIASSDRHTVKPWFNGRLAQAPRVIELAPEGFPLVGARIDVIAGVPVPVLVYRHRQHLISVSAVASAIPGTVRRAVRGYNLVGWSDGTGAYWAVSDLGGADLDTFARTFRTAPTDQ